jgi:hypothetical protein
MMGCILESMVEQGEKMRRTVTSQQSGGQKKPIAFGTVVCIKVGRADRGRLDPHSVPDFC